ncbi:MAG: ATP-dependent protease LonB [Candidatus Altiarchaeota archaeon]|nr:ATP-dependent protease LonB [Candidatus Altiarchaeota archaeon]
MVKIKGFKADLPASTSSIKIPPKTIDQVIGQEKAAEIISRAALQRRHVLLIGKPGTGKSMLAQGMAELLPVKELQDIMVVPNREDENNPLIKTFPAGYGKVVAHQFREKARAVSGARTTLITALMVAIGVITFYYTFILRMPQALFSGIIAAAFLMMLSQQLKTNKIINIPKVLVNHRTGEKAPFIDATGAHEGSLLGDVRHDPFQSGGLQTPSHERVESGAIHRAHRGVLFIDEIATLEPKMQVALLTGMQEKKFPITGRSERSAGAMVRTAPVPCDFVLVAAGNLDTMRRIHPALRSRVQGGGYEVFMNETMLATKANEEKLIRFIAQEVTKDKKIPHFSAQGTAEILRVARRMGDRKGHLTLRLRELGGIIRAAGDLAKQEKAKLTDKKHVIKALIKARPLEKQVAHMFIDRKKEYQVILTEGSLVGRVNGLAVMGDAGIVLPIEAEVVPCSGTKSEVIATGNLGKIANEAVKNVSATIRKWFGKDLRDYDIYVQFLQTYEGVEGDSASIAVANAIISAISRLKVRQDTAMTGSLSIRGEVMSIGGINPKIEAAIDAGMKRVLVPSSNIKDIVIEKTKKIEIIPVKTLGDVVSHALINGSKLVKQIKSSDAPIFEVKTRQKNKKVVMA